MMTSILLAMAVICVIGLILFSIEIKNAKEIDSKKPFLREELPIENE